MEERDTDGELQLVIAFHNDVGVLPPPGPRPTMVHEKAIEAGGAGSIEDIDDGCWVGKDIGIGPVDGDTVEGAALSTACVSRAALVVEGVVRRRQEGWPGPKAFGTSDPQDGGPRVGQRRKASTLGGALLDARPLTEDPGTEIEDALQLSDTDCGAGYLEDPGPSE
jgi:hypothetical protein